MDFSRRKQRGRTTITSVRVVTVTAALAGAWAAFAGTPNLNLKPGKYVVKITYEVQDQRQNELRTTTRCITRRDLDDPERILNEQTSAPAESVKTCSVRNLRSTNRQISYDADCANRTVHVDGNVSGNRFSVVRAIIPKRNKAVSLRFTVRGRRTDDCSTSEP